VQEHARARWSAWLRTAAKFIEPRDVLAFPESTHQHSLMKSLLLLLTASTFAFSLGACAGTPKKETSAACCPDGANMKHCPAGDPHCHVKPKKK
jgi:hypothetical protein